METTKFLLDKAAEKLNSSIHRASRLCNKNKGYLKNFQNGLQVLAGVSFQNHYERLSTEQQQQQQIDQ